MSNDSDEGLKPDLRVLVLWSDNKAANLGLRVLAQGNAELVKRALGANVVVDFQDFGPGDSEVSFGTKSILRDIGRKAGPIKSKISKYDLIVDSGAGDSFADIYGLKRLSFILYAHRVIRRFGIPLILGPQTIGPFNTRIGRFFARRSLHQASVILVRDSESAAYARELGIEVTGSATDVVFALPSAPVPTTRDVVLNVSGLLWFGDDHLDSSFYQSQVLSLVSSLLASGRSVSLLAHVVHSKSGNDDVDASREVIKAHSQGGQLELLIPDDLAQARDFLGSARVVVGARMHACLNALSMGTPAIPWAYSRKFAPLMKDIGWEHGLDLRDEPSPGDTTARIILETDWEQSAAHLARLREGIDARLALAVDLVRPVRVTHAALR